MILLIYNWNKIKIINLAKENFYFTLTSRSNSFLELFNNTGNSFIEPFLFNFALITLIFFSMWIMLCHFNALRDANSKIEMSRILL